MEKLAHEMRRFGELYASCLNSIEDIQKSVNFCQPF